MDAMAFRSPGVIKSITPMGLSYGPMPMRCSVEPGCNMFIQSVQRPALTITPGSTSKWILEHWPE